MYWLKTQKFSFPKLHIRNNINGKAIQKDKIIELIKNEFGTKIRLQKNGIYRIDSATLAKFFETFFIYDHAWKPLNNSKINKLIETLNKVWY